MQSRKNYLFTAAGALAVIGASVLFSPRRSEAQFSSPVRVLNPSTAPVLNSPIDDPGRIPYQSTLLATCSGTTCNFTFGAVPAGHRLVIQHVSTSISYTDSTTSGVYGVLEVAPGSLALTNFGLPIAAKASLFDQPVQVYYDAGQAPEVHLFIIGSGTFLSAANSQYAVMTGYELDCNAAPCAAIAQ
jgi:hypothetical protein